MCDDTQKSLVVPEEQGIIAQGEELRLARHGTRLEIRRYLDLQREQHGRSAELHSADLISAEKGHIRVNILTVNHALINPGNPGGEGTTAEHVEVIRRIISDVSEASLEETAKYGALYTWKRKLFEFDPDEDPPVREITLPEQLRDTLTRMLAQTFSTLPYYRRNRDLEFTDHAPGSGPAPSLGFVPSSDGNWYANGRKATAAELRHISDRFFNDPLPGNNVYVPDVDPIESLDVFSDAELRLVIKAGKFPGACSREEIQEAWAADGNEGWFWQAERVQEALPGGRPVLALELSWAQKIAALVPWKGPLSELAEAIGWPGKPQSLSVQVKKLRGELLSLGVIVEKTGGRTGKNLLEEWAAGKIIGEIGA
jgi:hypothetical protein